MLRELKYRLANGSYLSIPAAEIFAEYGSIYSWSRKADYSGYKAVSSHWDTNDITVQIYIESANQAEAEQARIEMLDEMFATGSDYTGRIYIGDWYREVMPIGVSDPEAAPSLGITFDMDFALSDERWKKDTVYNYGSVSTIKDGLDHPYDYEFDYGAVSVVPADLKITNYPANWNVKIYGQALNPSITFGGVTRAIQDGGTPIPVLTGKSTVWNSENKTVYLDGDSVFRYRTPLMEFFNPIPIGTTPVSWDGTFSFDLTITEQIDLPPWL